ncbi:MAG TPA: hypothetical protein VJA18_02220 [Candidatus Nanoarchaeia archaeon]|nr:hypothetical protein [Candidatus Nanoarchaeia archaeon]
MPYAVYRTEIFSKKLSIFTEDFKEQIDQIEEHLKDNPYVGKPLGVRWFREKKLDVFRMYYLIYEDLQAVYIITLSGKKDQQKVINTIRVFLEQYRIEIEEKLNS